PLHKTLMSSTHTKLYFHVVFSTKLREPWLVPDWRQGVHSYLGGIVKSLDGIPLTIGGVADHVHLLLRLRPVHCISEVLRQVKRGSSVWIHERFRRSAFAWQEGYGAFSVSHRDVPAVRRYIETQEEHHRVKTFQEEYVDLLTEHGLEFDSRFLW
ncbi:MAG TPA: IS200/IS605 family transposase, partial [Thermoanaerobaculia bacterium]|nr:IS200/IS605 family transposase [Thermoanaerobaculia bacterium]